MIASVYMYIQWLLEVYTEAHNYTLYSRSPAPNTMGFMLFSNIGYSDAPGSSIVIPEFWRQSDSSVWGGMHHTGESNRGSHCRPVSAFQSSSRTILR